MKRKTTKISTKKNNLKTKNPDFGFKHPIFTEKLIGHEYLEKIFLQSFYSKKMPHAWLFFGKKGIGKATSAFIFARALLAKNKNDEILSLEISKDNPTFKRMIAQSHTDFLLIEKDEERSEISVDKIRKIQPFIRMTSAETAYKIIIVDNIDNLSVEAANALLKSLEEPPSNVFFFLISHKNPGATLATIKSRCHLVRMHELSRENTEKIIMQNFMDEKDKIMQNFDFARGSPGILLSLYKNNILSIYNQILSIWSGGKFSPNALSLLSERCSALKNEKSLEVFFFASDYFFSRLVKSHANLIDKNEFSPLEEEVFPHLLNKTSLAGIFDIWEKARAFYEDVDRIYLDVQTAIIASFTPFSTASTFKKQN